MKRRTVITLMCVAALTLAPHEADAQGFLKKLKQKAEKVMGKTADAEEETDASADQANTLAATPTATDRIPKLRQSTLVWDGEVQPSSASTVQGLLNELPALPSVEAVVTPDEKASSDYYNRLTAIDLRVRELDDQWACSDEEMLAAREKIYKEMEGLLGLTAEEMKRLEDPNLSQAERERLTEKARNHFTGGADMEGIAAKAESKKPRLEQLEKEMEVLEKKEKKGTLTDADKQRMMEISQEMMAMHQDLMNSGLGNVLNASQQADAFQKKVTGAYVELERRLKKYSDKMVALRKNEDGVVKTCSQIAGEYGDRLRAIYEQVWQTNDADSIHALYDQADELMKNYRTRAAKIFLRGLQLRLENTKKLLPEAESLYKEMANNEMIPACATRRAPLNVVTQCVEILHEAYASFPQPEVLPLHREAFDFLKPEEKVYYGECGFTRGFASGAIGSSSSGGGSGSGIVEEFIAGSHLLVYNSKDQCFYEIKGGKRINRGKDGEKADFSGKVKRSSETYGEIPLRRGNRKANYSRSAALTLHDGTVVFPLLMKRYDDRLEFIVREYSRDSNEQFVKCVYKL